MRSEYECMITDSRLWPCESAICIQIKPRTEPGSVIQIVSFGCVVLRFLTVLNLDLTQFVLYCKSYMLNIKVSYFCQFVHYKQVCFHSVII